MGVALPPTSVPMERVQARVSRWTPCMAERLWITGIMVAAKGMLSMKALATAEPKRIMAIIRWTLLPLTLPMPWASRSSTPLRCSPLMTTKSPMKKMRVLWSICRRMATARLRKARSVTAAMSTPMAETVSPVCAWVESRSTAARKMAQLPKNSLGSLMASLGSRFSSRTGAERNSLWKQRQK